MNKPLLFTCPECGWHRLASIEQVVISYPITSISPDGDLDYDFDKADNDYGDAVVLNYACINCGFVPKQGDVEICDCDALAKWVQENCPQH